MWFLFPYEKGGEHVFDINLTILCLLENDLRHELMSESTMYEIEAWLWATQEIGDGSIITEDKHFYDYLQLDGESRNDGDNSAQTRLQSCNLSNRKVVSKSTCNLK